MATSRILWLGSLMILIQVECTLSEEVTALLIIDVQNCFVPNGTLAVDEGDEVIPVINELRRKHGSLFDLTVLSQDWHCADHVSFASQHPGYDPLNVKDLHYDDDGNLCKTENVTNYYAIPCPEEMNLLQQTLWPDHCIINTTDADLRHDLSSEENDILLQKGYKCHLDSYSTFYDNGRFGETELRQILEDNDVTTMYITGLATDYCVYWSAKDSKELGFETYVVVDATRGIDPGSTQAALADMASLGILLVNSTDIAAPTNPSSTLSSIHASNVFLAASLVAFTTWNRE